MNGTFGNGSAVRTLASLSTLFLMTQTGTSVSPLTLVYKPSTLARKPACRIRPALMLSGRLSVPVIAPFSSLKPNLVAITTRSR